MEDYVQFVGNIEKRKRPVRKEKKEIKTAESVIQKQTHCQDSVHLDCCMSRRGARRQPLTWH